MTKSATKKETTKTATKEETAVEQIQDQFVSNENFEELLKEFEKDAQILKEGTVAKGVIVEIGTMEEWGGINDWRNLEIVDADNSVVYPATELQKNTEIGGAANLFLSDGIPDSYTPKSLAAVSVNSKIIAGQLS